MPGNAETTDMEGRNLPFLRKLFTFKYHKPSDLQQLLISMLGFVLVIVGLTYTAWQLNAQANATDRAVSQALSTSNLDTDKLFIDSPQLRPYFFNGKKLNSTEISSTDYNKALAIADYQLDFFSVIFDQEQFSKELQASADLRNAWDSYMQQSFKKSPIMCSELKARGEQRQFISGFIGHFKADC